MAGLDVLLQLQRLMAPGRSTPVPYGNPEMMEGLGGPQLPPGLPDAGGAASRGSRATVKAG